MPSEGLRVLRHWSWLQRNSMEKESCCRHCWFLLLLLFCSAGCLFRDRWNVELLLLSVTLGLKVNYGGKKTHMLCHLTLYLDIKHCAIIIIIIKITIIKGDRGEASQGKVRVSERNLGLWLLLTFSKRSFFPQHLSGRARRNDGLPAEGTRRYL